MCGNGATVNVSGGGDGGISGSDLTDILIEGGHGPNAETPEPSGPTGQTKTLQEILKDLKACYADAIAASAHDITELDKYFRPQFDHAITGEFSRDELWALLLTGVLAGLAAAPETGGLSLVAIGAIAAAAFQAFVDAAAIIISAKLIRVVFNYIRARNTEDLNYHSAIADCQAEYWWKAGAALLNGLPPPPGTIP